MQEHRYDGTNITFTTVSCLCIFHCLYDSAQVGQCFWLYGFDTRHAPFVYVAWILFGLRDSSVYSTVNMFCASYLLGGSSKLVTPRTPKPFAPSGTTWSHSISCGWVVSCVWRVANFSVEGLDRAILSALLFGSLWDFVGQFYFVVASRLCNSLPPV